MADALITNVYAVHASYLYIDYHHVLSVTLLDY